MARVTLSLGSNIDRDYHLRVALDALADEFAPLTLSQVYETKPVGLTADPFYNLVVAFDTEATVGEVQHICKHIEQHYARSPATPPQGYTRALDLDLLTYGDLTGVHDGILLPRAEVLKHDFVLRPLAELFPDQHMPGRHESYAELWQTHAHPDQWMTPVSFQWPHPTSTEALSHG